MLYFYADFAAIMWSVYEEETIYNSGFYSCGLVFQRENTSAGIEPGNLARYFTSEFIDLWTRNGGV